jgi:hypothetical protein
LFPLQENFPSWVDFLKDGKDFLEAALARIAIELEDIVYSELSSQGCFEFE